MDRREFERIARLEAQQRQAELEAQKGNPHFQHKERDYSIIPIEINQYSDLDDFDEYEARKANWPDKLICQALLEIQRRELN